MYSFLTGVLAAKNPTSVTIDVNGIGFEVIVPLSTSHKLPAVGQKVKLLTHHIVREDHEFLCGFGTEEERSLFKLLMSVAGIGPKMAVTILSGLGIGDLKRAIVEGSIPMLTAISGIGRKTAERLIVELREKLVVETRSGEKVGAVSSQNEALIEDSVRALVSLGYTKQSAKAAIQKVLQSSSSSRLDTESLIRESLKQIQYV
ncbi:MAG: Holliday junction branch migration protein RuvA [Candidatus Omnitrophica bacterium]|nr:Holliday junction branch migration protein RuvA [Candidatus Omnitrophota bacterium]